MKHGVPLGTSHTTCSAGVGTLLLEFGTLSRLLGDPTYEITAKNALNAIWKYRSKNTGLLGSVMSRLLKKVTCRIFEFCRLKNCSFLGNTINIVSGEWVGSMSGIGAGMDSLYEYLLKVNCKIFINTSFASL